MTIPNRPKAYSYVRISSKGQIDGAGLARQIEKAIKYAEDHNLDLDTQLKDVGKSGFHGAHVKAGALGAFLKMVKDGQIPVGSYLLVEALDRLSRQNVLIAQMQFSEVLLAGIHIVTLIDNQVYHRDRDHSQLILSLSLMKTANDESAKKSVRNADAIRRRKMAAVAGEPVYNHHIVGWIDQELIPGTKHYKFTLNHKAKAIQRIFELANQGVGGHSIARILNDEKYPVMRAAINKRNMWRDATIHAILRDERVIGTNLVFETINRKKVPLGDPIKNYYPAAISEELYWRVQRNRPKTVPMGSKGKRYANLFARNTSCSKCGAVLKLVNGGAENRRKHYYTCMQGWLSKDHPCRVNSKFIPYDPIEDAVLLFATDFYVAAADVLNVPERNQDLLAKLYAEGKAQLATLAKRRENLMAMAEEVDNPTDRKALIQRMGETREKIEQQTAYLAELNRDIQMGQDKRDELRGVVDQVEAERKKWRTGTLQEVFESRSKVSKMLREFITTVEVDFENQTTTVWIGGFTSAYRFDRAGKLIGQINLLRMMTPNHTTIYEPFPKMNAREKVAIAKSGRRKAELDFGRKPAITDEMMIEFMQGMGWQEDRMQMALAAKRKIVEANA